MRIYESLYIVFVLSCVFGHVFGLVFPYWALALADVDRGTYRGYGVSGSQISRSRLSTHPRVDQALPAPPPLRHPVHPAAHVAFFQPGHMYLLAALVEASVALFIYSRLTPIRGGMGEDPKIRALILQETCKASLVPFAIGDIAVTFCALGWETTKNVRGWNVVCRV